MCGIIWRDEIIVVMVVGVGFRFLDYSFNRVFILNCIIKFFEKYSINFFSLFIFICCGIKWFVRFFRWEDIFEVKILYFFGVKIKFDLLIIVVVVLLVCNIWYVLCKVINEVEYFVLIIMFGLFKLNL